MAVPHRSGHCYLRMAEAVHTAPEEVVEVEAVEQEMAARKAAQAHMEEGVEVEGVTIPTVTLVEHLVAEMAEPMVGAAELEVCHTVQTEEGAERMEPTPEGLPVHMVAEAADTARQAIRGPVPVPETAERVRTPQPLL